MHAWFFTRETIASFCLCSVQVCLCAQLRQRTSRPDCNTLILIYLGGMIPRADAFKGFCRLERMPNSPLLPPSAATRPAGGAASGMSSTSHRALGHPAAIVGSPCCGDSPLRADAAKCGHAATDCAARGPGPCPAGSWAAFLPDAPNGRQQSFSDPLCCWPAATPAGRGPSGHPALPVSWNRQSSASCSCCGCSYFSAGAQQRRGGRSGGGRGAHLSGGDLSPAAVLGRRGLRALAAAQHRGARRRMRVWGSMPAGRRVRCGGGHLHRLAGALHRAGLQSLDGAPGAASHHDARAHLWYTMWHALCFHVRTPPALGARRRAASAVGSIRPLPRPIALAADLPRCRLLAAAAGCPFFRRRWVLAP